MKNADLQIEDLAFKLLFVLKGAGIAGLTRTELLQTIHCKTANLTLALKLEEARFNIVGRQMRKSEFSLGRQPTRYWYKDFAPREVLTATSLPVTPTLELGAVPPKGGTCEQCGSAIVPHGPGRPPVYCSPACRGLAMEGGVTLGRFLDRAQDPRVFAQVAILLVVMDLTCRGFNVALDLFLHGSNIIIHDNINPVILTVLPVSDAGYLPPDDQYERMAAVYRDGRIKYGGRDPLVFENKAGVANVETEKGSL
jgi:hypothetical protein